MKRSPLRHVDRFLADYTASHTRQRWASQLPSEGLKMPQKEHAGNYRACTYEHLNVQLRAKKRGFVLGSCPRESAAVREVCYRLVNTGLRSTVWHACLQECIRTWKGSRLVVTCVTGWNVGHYARRRQKRQAMYLQRKNEASSCKHCSRGKAVSITYSDSVRLQDCVSYPACNAHAPYYIGICGLSGSTIYFRIIL